MQFRLCLLDKITEVFVEYEESLRIPRVGKWASSNLHP